MVLREPRCLAELVPPRLSPALAEVFLSELLRVCAAFLVLVGKTVTSAAVPEQVDAVECLSEARLAAAVLRLAADQALPGVCESGLRPTPWARAAMARVFVVSMFAPSDPCFFFLPSSPAAGTTQQRRQAKGKGN